MNDEQATLLSTQYHALYELLCKAQEKRDAALAKVSTAFKTAEAALNSGASLDVILLADSVADALLSQAEKAEADVTKLLKQKNEIQQKLNANKVVLTRSEARAYCAQLKQDFEAKHGTDFLVSVPFKADWKMDCIEICHVSGLYIDYDPDVGTSACTSSLNKWKEWELARGTKIEDLNTRLLSLLKESCAWISFVPHSYGD
ncbi:hypothetical protein [Janthinobacterium sp. CG_23.4]|uniref:hypothetical protein n=1 Tax=Janthinobacterium sp. CG_23.4 TaxID=2760707 RepID=UPI0024732646|nr:hypothetical protein [Janthinobacterium sp. CG_23.4]MDH6160327.1 hypothetical protein [Janthinobacterium sp. CG_23.4]